MYYAYYAIQLLLGTMIISPLCLINPVKTLVIQHVTMSLLKGMHPPQLIKVLCHSGCPVIEPSNSTLTAKATTHAYFIIQCQSSIEMGSICFPLTETVLLNMGIMGLGVVQVHNLLKSKLFSSHDSLFCYINIYLLPPKERTCKFLNLF